MEKLDKVVTREKMIQALRYGKELSVIREKAKKWSESYFYHPRKEPINHFHCSYLECTKHGPKLYHS